MRIFACVIDDKMVNLINKCQAICLLMEYTTVFRSGCKGPQQDSQHESSVEWGPTSVIHEK